MQLTHQEARHLIQARADQTLDVYKKEVLNAHLRSCMECADYANEIQETVTTLRTTLQKHWNVHPAPLPLRDLKVKVISYPRLFDILAIRSALLGVTMVFFLFVLWQFTSTNYGTQNSITVGVPAIPTPSLLLTSTQSNFAHCQMIRYDVSQDDTFASLARRYSISEEVIRELNHMQPDMITLPTMLILPLCELTPTSTTHPPASITNTPPLELISYTPG
jgi:hypothetical protein